MRCANEDEHKNDYHLQMSVIRTHEHHIFCTILSTYICFYSSAMIAIISNVDVVGSSSTVAFCHFVWTVNDTLERISFRFGTA